MANGTPPNGGVTQWRIQRIETDVQKLDRDKAEKADVSRIEQAVNRLTWALVGFAFTVAGSAVALLLTAGRV